MDSGRNLSAMSLSMGEVSSSVGRARSLLWVNHFAVPPSEAGGTRHFELARELVKLGWVPTVAASDFNLHSRRYTRREEAGERQPVVEHIEGVEFVWLWASAYLKNNWRRAVNWLTFARSAIAWNPRVAAPDVVIGSSPHLFAALAGARVASRLGVPFVLELRDLWPESLLAAGGRKGVAYHFFGAIARHLYRRADRIVVLARGSVDHLVQLGVDRTKIAYVPNGVDTSAFASVVRPPRTSNARFTIVYAGAHGSANGLDTVIDSAERLRHRSDIRFLLVGDGPAKASLQASAAARGLGNVEFRPPVPKSGMPALLSSVDAGLMVLRDSPLFAYGVSPNKLFDYLGAGLPVVCNVPGEVAAMLREARAGVQTEDGSPDALADAVLRIRECSTEELAAMGSAGQAWVAREHGPTVLASRLDGMLRELVER
jgi:glycosyltransferase involved in cell wall biosynthesis